MPFRPPRPSPRAPAPRRRRPPTRLGVAALVACLVPLLVASCTRAGPAEAVPAPAPAAPAPTGPVALRDRAVFGAYVPDLPSGRRDLPALEAALGTRVDLVSAFADWAYVFGGADDRWMADGGRRKVLYSWEPFGLRFAAVARGEADGYLQRVADAMRAYPYDIHVRPWGEMNANWSSWQPTPGGGARDGGTPAEFIAAWRHTVSFFRSRGVRNLRFVFAPDASDYADNTPIATIWPGADYVDVLGIDGYNWGADAGTGDTWREFDEIFAGMYATLTALHPSAPVWITEVGSKEPAVEDGAPVDPAHSKAAWIDRMMSTTAFPRIEALAYFSVRKERDWRVDSTPSALAALRAQLARRSAGAAPASPTGPAGAPAPAPTGDAGERPLALVNASLEADADGDGVPDCFVRGGYGTNAPTWSRAPGHTGVSAQRLRLASVVDGDRKLVIAHTPACAPAVTPGSSYRLSAWYQSSAGSHLVAFVRDAAGAWRYWATGSLQPASPTWRRAVFTTPPVPAGASALSFGLSLDMAGTLTVDDFGMGVVTRDQLPNGSFETDADGDGAPDCFALAGYGRNEATWSRVGEARTGRWAQRLVVSDHVDGDRKILGALTEACAPAVAPGRRYTLGAAYRSTAGVTIVTYYRDAAGVWRFWQSSPVLSARSVWTRASFVTDPTPAGATAVSFGVALSTDGTVIVDDYSVTG